MYKLYGDGIHDDTNAIQELLDSKISLVELPAPKKHYSISRTLKIYSGQTFRLGETTVIKLLPNSNCQMITNGDRPSHDISIVGGIWDYDNVNQAPNPIIAPDYHDKYPTHFDGNPNTVKRYGDEYRGSIMRFYQIERFSIHDLTLKNPVTYCLEMAYIRYFTVENIRFDQNFGNPTAQNMDGIHVDGGCRFGSIRNVQGTCYDDIVALNADDGCDGPIEDIEVDGVFGLNSLRGVRLLSIKSEMNRISINNVFGTFYQNCIVLAYFYTRSGVHGKMNNISISNIFAENDVRIPECKKTGPYFFSLIWLDGDIDYGNINISKVYRDEKIGNVETIHVCENAKIDTLALSHVYQKNYTGEPITLFKNDGEIDRLVLNDICAYGDKEFENNGTIKNIIKCN